MSQEHYQRTLPFSRVPILHPAIFYDNASGTFNWLQSGDGVDFTADYHADAAFVDTNGIRLITKSTTPAENDLVTINRILWMPPINRLRFQACFHFPTYAINCRLKFWVETYDGLTLHATGIAANPQNGVVYYISALPAGAPTWSVLPGVTIPMADAIWSKLDFSTDFATDYNHLLHLNSTVLDVSAVAVPTFGSPAQRRLTLFIQLQTLQIAQATAYVDQVLLTPENP